MWSRAEDPDWTAHLNEIAVNERRPLRDRRSGQRRVLQVRNSRPPDFQTATAFQAYATNRSIALVHQRFSPFTVSHRIGLFRIVSRTKCRPESMTIRALLGLGRLDRGDRATDTAPVRRYQRDTPGELIHVEVLLASASRHMPVLFPGVDHMPVRRASMGSRDAARHEG
jgi:hypothetical protein